MLLTRAQFDENLARSNLNIAFIGMSNIGKSYLSEQLETQDGFERIDVDKEIQDNLGFTSMEAIADWLGHPFDAQYEANARTCLVHEGEVSLRDANADQNTVLDTTGSVVHLVESIQEEIKTNYLTVYLKASDADMAILKDRYFRFPKPTIWPKKFINKMSASRNDTEADALMKLFPDLLTHRAVLYEKLSDVTIPACEFADNSSENRGILAKIRASLAP